MSAVPADHPSGDARVCVVLPELLALRAQAARLRLPPQRSRAPTAGPQASRLYGRGMDYAESRAYQPGDDVRRLDWRLTARSGRLHTKLFQEEREGRLLILVDTHPGLRFGTRVRFKSVQVARAAAVAAWYGVRAGERVGALAFGGSRQLLAPRGGSQGAVALCGALARWDQAAVQASEPLSDALTRAAHLPHGASRMLLVSDGACFDPAAAARLQELARRSQVAVLIVADPLELAPPPAGRYPIEHAGLRREIELQSEAARHRFQRTLGAGLARLREQARALGLPCATIDTSAEPGEAIAGLLVRKVSR